MARFNYTARDSTGRQVRDTVEAASRKAALRLLSTRQLQPIELSETTATSAQKKPTSIVARKVAPRAKDLLPFFTALTELTTSGMSSGEAVRLLAMRVKDPRLKALCGEIWIDLKEGQTLSQAMEGMPLVFDVQAVNMVRAGEATGNLGEVLQRLISHYEEQRELRRRIATAMAYPAFVVLGAFGLILLFVFFLMPKLQGLLNSLGGEMPWSTQLLVVSSGFLVSYGWLVIPVMIILGLALWRWRQTTNGRAIIDAQTVKLPLIRNWVIDTGVLVFVQTLTVLLENGINTVEALRLTERTVNNLTMRAALRQATDRVLEGESLSAALTRTGFFPDLVLDRLAVGESTGKLAPSLRDISRHYSQRHARRLESFIGITANGVLMAAFAFVGFLAFAIVSAVLKVSSSFQF